MRERIGHLSPGRHVPRLAMEWLAETPEERWRSVRGAMVFADISGFTALSERLAQRGRIGAEELVETLSRIFSVMLDVTSHRGGQLIKFGGDALLLLFDERDTNGDAAGQAASAAVEMRAALREASQIRTSVGRLNLRISIGIHAGTFDYFLVGRPHRELIALGPGLTSVVAAENAAVAGEILLSPAAADGLAPTATTDGTEGHRRLLWRKAPVPPAGRPPRINDREAAKHLLPAILFPLVDGVRPDPGHRVGTIAFMKFSGTDAILAAHGPAHLADALDQTLRIAQAAYEREDVALLCVDGDKDGGKLFVSSGVPLTSEDDEGRMLRAARTIMAARPPLDLQIGINRGHVFAAEVGSLRRAAYSAMGDTTNTAARICAKAVPGEILVHPAVLEYARTRYESEPVGPFTFKGKALPQVLYRLGGEIGPRERDEADELPIVGRDAELDLIRTAIAQAEHGATIEILGPVGVGKSRLLNEAVRTAPARPRILMHAEPYGAASYRVFRDPIREVLGIARSDQHTMRETLLARLADVAPDLLDLAALVGDVAQVDVDPSATVKGLLPAHRPDRLADTVIELLGLLHPEGLTIVMEDAHWADPASALLLRRIAAETHRRPWLLFLSHRSGGETSIHLDGADVRLDLTPLSNDAVRTLAVTMTESAPLRPDELELVVARADGSPLFTREMIRAGQELGSLEAVPSSLQGAVAAQVDMLGPITRRSLSYASVLGRSFRGAVFRDLLDTEGINYTDELEEDLLHFLAIDDQDRWQFRHGVLSEVVYDGLGYNLRARLHRDAGRAVERLSNDLPLDADTLAVHFSRAGRHKKAYRYAVLAASRSEMAHAAAAAATQLALALEEARRLQLPPSEVRDLWMRLADAREMAGSFDGALDALRHAGRLPADALESGRLWIRRAEVRLMKGSFPAALRDSARATRAVTGLTSPEAASVRARGLALTAHVRMRQEKPSAAFDHSLQAVAAAEACDDVRALAQAEAVLMWAEIHHGREDRAKESAHRALRLYEQLDDLIGKAKMALNLGTLAYYDGDWDASVDFYRTAIDGFTRAGEASTAHVSAVNVSEVLINQGRLDEAEPLLVAAHGAFRASGHWATSWSEIHLGRVHAGRGRLADAERVFLDSIAQSREMGSEESVYEAAIHLASCLVAAGRPTEALERLEEADLHAPSLLDASACLARARAYASLGQPSAAAEAVRTGVAAARERHLEFDLAGLLIAAADLGITDLGSRTEADDILNRLGVVGAH